ncbi:MAG: hypothetical protein JWR52_2096 [Marmoricola sp.]|nr:hypothetical protein [Marmoricola sp.]
MDHRPELDGIRALAVLAVLAYHSYLLLALCSGGWLGVDVFFVLSGYLITAILLSEHRRTGRLDFRRFYVRRLERLYPALLVALVLGAVFYRTIGDGGTFVGYLRTAGAAGLYVENFVWGLGGHELGKFGHTWSLAVEMQFYLVWPPLLGWLVARKSNLIAPVVAGIAVSYVLLVTEMGREPTSFPVAYYMPWTRAFELLIGALVAVTLTRGARAERHSPRRWTGWLILAALGFAFVLAAGDNISVHPAVIAWQSPLVAALTAGLLVHLDGVRTRGVGAVLAWAPLAWLGRISYGVYLFHYPVLTVLRAHGVAGASTGFVLGGGISILLAAASYRVIEQPILSRRSRPGAQRVQPIV